MATARGIAAPHMPNAQGTCFLDEGDMNFRRICGAPTATERMKRDSAQCESPITQRDSSDDFSFMNVASTARSCADMQRDIHESSNFDVGASTRGMNEVQLRHHVNYAGRTACSTILERTIACEESEHESINGCIYLNLEYKEGTTSTETLKAGDHTPSSETSNVSLGPATYMIVAQQHDGNEPNSKANSCQIDQVLNLPKE